MSEVVPARLPADLAKSLDKLVRSGRYRNRSEAVKEATRMLVSLGGLPPQAATAKMVARIASLAIAWNTPEAHAIVLYGSVARGQVTSDSDVDLLVVVRSGEPWRVRRKLYDLVYPVMAGTSVDISLLVVTASDWEEMVELRDPVAVSIMEEGQVLWGKLARQS